MNRIVQLLGVTQTRETLQANAHVWHDALVAIAKNTMHVDAASINGNVTLLHLACYHGKVDVVRQLLFVLHANPSVETKIYKYRPMHYAALSTSSNALAICRLLPVADLAHASTCGRTPLFQALNDHVEMDPDLFQWMIQQPQCDVIVHYAAIKRGLRALRGEQRYIAIMDAEVAVRKRWTPARAAWCAAACVCA